MSQLANAGVIISILLIVSMGLAIIYGLMNVINLAHSEFLMIGAYGLVISNLAGWPAWTGFLIGPALVAVLSFLFERGLVRFLYRRPLDSLLATYGLSIILVQAVRVIFGPAPQRVQTPIPGALALGDLPLSNYRVFVLVIGFVLTGILLILFRYPTFAVKTHAVLQDAEMAQCVGIRSSRVYTGTFVVGGALAGLAGALIAPLVTVSPQMGGPFLVRAFLTVIVGGAGHLVGVLGGSAVIGGVEGAVSSFSSSALGQVVTLALAIVIVRLRPSGIFRRK